nr:MAG TPA_asm: tyrosine phosphatase family protein [Bacteriophage sp.]
MAKKLYEESSVQAIAAAIREKNGAATKYKVAEMADAVRALSGSEVVEWHQCPEAVRNYLANVTYDSSDYSASQIANYAPATAVVSNYKPIGKTLGGKTYYNQVPGVETPFAATGKAGTLKPLDFLRYIQTNTWNVRDLGGWACDGGTVKYGKLFRGGYVTSADRAVLVEQLGIQHELDLRGANEGGLTASPLGGDVRYTCAAAYAWYSLTPADAWKANLRCVFDAVTHNEPVYFHCAAGADRTGTLACVLEGLLGMSQSDIDKDYELTTFYSGSDTDANARRRNEAEWSGLISALNSKSGSTFRDKCVTFAAELGFTAAEINAYRKAMIDGTPSTVTPSISTFTVTNAIEGAASDNAATEVTQYQPYEAAISAQNGKTISSVSVKMDGVDITAEVWRGDETELYHKITFNLGNCFADNTQLRVIDGQSFGANISPDAGYELDGAIVSITMGGTDVSIYYSGGKIAIPRVTGNLVITISAVESGVVAPNILVDSFKAGGVSHAAVGYSNGKRLSTGSGVEKDNAGSCVTGFIPCRAGSVIRIRPLAAPSSSGVGATAVVFYNSEKAMSTASYITTAIASQHFGNCTWAQESSDVYKVTFNADFPATYKYVRFGIPVADGANAYVTYDAEMPEAGN